MKVLIVYGSHLGSTAAIAEEIADTLRRTGEIQVTVHAASAPVTVNAFDAVIVGGGIYAGRWHPDAVAFVERHRAELLERPVWFFSSGPLGSGAGRPAPVASPDVTRLATVVRPRDAIIFAGAHDRSEVDASELTRLEKFIAKRFVPEGDWRDWAAIEAWAAAIAKDLTSVGLAAI